MDDCTVAANEVKYISDDLLMKILFRLPPKTLVVCKCVSKSWRRLISSLIHSPFTGLFLPFHLCYGQEATKLFNRRDDKIEVVDYSLNFLPCHPYTRLVDCQDGHLLCTSGNLGEKDYKYFVCNPITRQWASLPPPPNRSSSSGRQKFVNAALVLDVESDLCYSHFKVVRFFSYHEDVRRGEIGSADIYVDVYSSQTGKWRETKALMKHIGVYFLYRTLVHLDGVVFLYYSHHELLMYDVKEEYWHVLRLPVESRIFYLNCLGKCFGKSQGCLHYAYYNASQIKVWMMMVGGDSTREWVLKHSINPADINFPDPSTDDHPVRKGQQRIIAFHPNSDAIFIRKQGDFFCYNFNTKALEMVGYCYRPSDPSGAFEPYPFSYCLRPLVDAQQKT